jgi:hypothetical protein
MDDFNWTVNTVNKTHGIGSSRASEFISTLWSFELLRWKQQRCYFHTQSKELAVQPIGLLVEVMVQSLSTFALDGTAT